MQPSRSCTICDSRVSNENQDHGNMQQLLTFLVFLSFVYLSNLQILLQQLKHPFALEVKLVSSDTRHQNILNSQEAKQKSLELMVFDLAVGFYIIDVSQSRVIQKVNQVFFGPRVGVSAG